MTAHTHSTRFGSGKSVRRVEDDALLTGRDRFADNFSLPGQGHLAFVRSPHAHATIASIDTSAAKTMPGVVAVITGADLAQAGVKPLVQSADFKRANGEADRRAAAARARDRHRALRRRGGRRRRRGDARTGARRRGGDRRPLRGAAAWWRRSPTRSSKVRRWCGRTRPATSRAWPSTATPTRRRSRSPAAAHVVTLDLVNQRLAPAPIEPRATLASYDAATRAHHAAPHLPDADRRARRARQRSARHRQRQDPRRWSATSAAASA